MAIDGRINVDVLFHDTDGTTALKVVSLEDSTAYTSGKVAIVTGTMGTTAVTFDISSGFGYRNAAGDVVVFSGILRLAFSASPAAFLEAAQPGIGGDNTLMSSNGTVSLIESPQPISVYTTSGTASYTLVLYGT